MKDLAFKIKTIKAGSQEEIEHFIDEVVTELRKIERLEPELRSYLEKAGLYIKEDQQKLLNVVLLSCILDDIAGQLSPFERESDSEKIRSICRKQSLNYNQLVNIMPYSNDILEIINSTIDDK